VTDATPALSLHPLQGLIFKDPHRFRVLVSGRRFGKTRLAIAELLSRIPTRGLLWYVAPTWDAARDICWRELKRFTPGQWLTKVNETRLEMEFLNGCRIQLKSAENADALRGRGITHVNVDEYQDIDAGVWTDVLAPSLLDTGAGAGTACFFGTPKSFNQLYDLYALGQSGHPEWKSWQFKSMDAIEPHGHLKLADIELFRSQLDARSFRQEFEASFEALSGRAYYAFARAEHVRDVELESAVPLCLSVDFNIDPSSAVIWQRVGEECRVWREVQTRHAGGEATRATAERARQLVSDAGWHGPLRLYGDATGRAGKTTGPSDHAVLREVFPGASWYIGANNPHVRDRVAAVNGRCKSMTGQVRFRVDPACVKLIADLEQVVFAENGELDKKSNPALSHLSDALGYGVAREWPPSKRLVDGRMFAGVDV
jgi:hypothetical protein